MFSLCRSEDYVSVDKNKILQVHHFIPLEPWTCNKIKGRRRQMKIDGTNDGPQSKFEKKEQIKLVLDMSNDGPMFKEQILFISKS